MTDSLDEMLAGVVTASKLAELLGYSAETGEIWWKERLGKKAFNAYLAGRPALAQMSKGYKTGRVLGVPLKAHRVIWVLHYGSWPEGHIDHINGDPSDNRVANLRVVSNAENMKNRSRPRQTEPCIYWRDRYQRWWVKVNSDGKQIHVGYFYDFDEAVSARNAAWVQNGFHPNHGRPIPIEDKNV